MLSRVVLFTEVSTSDDCMRARVEEALQKLDKSDLNLSALPNSSDPDQSRYFDVFLKSRLAPALKEYGIGYHKLAEFSVR